MRRFFGIFKDQRGATAVEYGLILAMIFLAMIGALTSFGTADHRHVELRRQRSDRTPELPPPIKCLETSSV